MSDYAIRVEGLGKRYRIGIEQTGGMYRYKSLRDSLGGLIRRPMQAVRSTVVQKPMDEQNSFWALNDVNFQIKRGEVVGIIGRNGAGKSTLLKILSRITKPTTGHIELRGRVGSLLEVGTGFHPELSGRENIYLNGAILGMTRAEVRSKFDEIVAFSEIEKFLDTAVKQYSSGMYTRLAFAVAAHLEPEILIVDEVLAVGDAEFQKKCLGKMQDVAEGGRTVLFVSHNLGQIASLCEKAIYLRTGRMEMIGKSRTVVDAYLKPETDIEGKATIVQGDVSVTVRTSLQHDPDATKKDYLFTDPISLNIELRSTFPIERAGLFLTISRSTGESIGAMCNFEEGLANIPVKPSVMIRTSLRTSMLTPGSYLVSVKLYDEGGRGLVFAVDSGWSFAIVPSPLRPGAWSYLAHHGLIRLADSITFETPSP